MEKYELNKKQLVYFFGCNLKIIIIIDNISKIDCLDPKGLFRIFPYFFQVIFRTRSNKKK